MKKEVRLKDLLTVDPTDGSYAHDPLDIVVTAYKKRKRDWMISEEDPECECPTDCDCDCDCHDIEESVYDTMSKYELNAELRRINAELDRLKKQDKTKQVQTSIDLLTNARDSVLEMLKEDVELTEALTPQQRMKRRQIMRRLKSRIKLGRQRASRRRASTEVLRARALRAARNELTKRMTGGKSKGELSFGARARIEKALAQKKTMIKSLAQRLLSQVRAKENARIKARTQQ
jgi:hypothetical protein